MERSQVEAWLRRASERLYGDSRLRDMLTDEQAEQLLGWGTNQVEAAVARTQELAEGDAVPQIEARTDAVRNVVRLVNEIVSQLPEATQARSREYMGHLVDALCEVDARTVHIDDMLALEKLVARREELDPSEIFRRLLAIIRTPKPTEEDGDQGDGAVEVAAGSVDAVPAVQPTVEDSRTTMSSAAETVQEEEE